MPCNASRSTGRWRIWTRPRGVSSRNTVAGSSPSRRYRSEATRGPWHRMWSAVPTGSSTRTGESWDVSSPDDRVTARRAIRSPRAGLLLIVGLALAIRLTLFFHGVRGSDAYAYARHAARLARGEYSPFAL